MKKVLLYQILVFIRHGKIYKARKMTINSKYQLQHGMINLNYQMDHILSIKIYVNKIENRITFKIKTGYSLELLTPETITLHGSTENKVAKDKNGENVPDLQITEVILVHCTIVNNDYQQDSRDLYTFVPNKLFDSLLEISPKNHIFLKKFNSKFQSVEVWFTDQNSQSLEIEYRINLTPVIK